MKHFYNVIKYLFYRLITKKMLITIILMLLFIIFLNNCSVFAATIDKNTGEGAPASYDVPDLDTLPEVYYNYANTYGYVIQRWDKNRYRIIVLTSADSFIYKSGNVPSGATSPYLTVSGPSMEWNINYSVSKRWDSVSPNAANGFYGFNFIYYGANIYTDSSKTDFYFKLQVRTLPYIMNSLSDLSTLSSETITVDSGNINIEDGFFDFIVQTKQAGTTNFIDIYSTKLSKDSPFYHSNGVNGDYYEIPVSVFKPRLIDGYDLRYTLLWLEVGSDLSEYVEYNTFYSQSVSGMTDTEIINNNIDRNFNIIHNTISSQNEIIQQQTDIAADTNKFLKDSSFDNSDLNIPNDSTEDITEGGINNIFTIIYNAFTSGEATDIVIPIPFTNKNITINSNLTSSILDMNGFGWVKNIVEVFWWYLISRFIVKDISKKIEKIKSGNIENIETNNIKEDML